MKIKKIKDLGIVIPAHNELDTIDDVTRKTALLADICVINDFSKDGTLDFLKKNRIKHINNVKQLGYEATIVKGIKYFLKKKKYIITFDADLQFKLSDIIKAYNKIKIENADIIVGSRVQKNRITEVILNSYFKFKYNIKDPISGLKIYKTNLLKKILKHSNKNNFLVDIITNAVKKKYKIRNFNIKTNKRLDKPRIGNILNSNFKIFKILIYTFFFKLNK